MSSRKKLAGQFGWMTSGRLAAALIQALAMVFLARLAGPGAFGVFAAAQGILMVSQAVSSLGLGTYVVKKRSEAPGDAQIGIALRLNEFTSFVYAILLIVPAGILALVAGVEYLWLVPLVLSFAAERSADVWLSVAVADGDAKVNSLNLILRRSVGLVLFLAGTLVLPGDALLTFSIAATLAAMFSWWLSRRFVVSRGLELPRLFVALKDRSARLVLRGSVHYWTNSVWVQLRNLDTSVASLVMGSAQAGFYAVASRLLSPLRLLPTSLAAVLLPAATRARHSGLRKFGLTVFVASLGVLVFYGLLGLVIPWFVPVLLGNEYEGAAPVVQLATFSIAFAGVASLLSAVLQGFNRGRFVSKTALVMTCTCLLGVAVGGLMAGAIGASAGLLVAYLLQVALLSASFVSILREDGRPDG